MSSRTVRQILPEALQLFHPFGLKHEGQSVSTARQQSALDTARQLATGLKLRFKATRVMLFGSATRSDFSQWSDIDLAVWGIAAADYYKAVAYVTGFSSVYKVDLVDADDCQPTLLQFIVSHGVEL